MSFSSFKRHIELGDTVILYISITQMYAIEVNAKIKNRKGQEIDNIFQTKYGALKVTSLIGKEFGSKVHLPGGWVYVLYPTPELWTITLPHRTQILYTPDISMVITQLEIGPGSVICEAGTGSGSLSHAILRAVGPTGKLHTSDFHKERSQVVLKEFEHHGFGDRVSVTHRDVCAEGFGLDGIADAAFLDLPMPWNALPHAISAIKSRGGRICSFSPCIEQVCRTCETMAEMGLTEISTLECLAREFQVTHIRVPVIGSEEDNELSTNGKEGKRKKMKLDNKPSENPDETANTETNSDEKKMEIDNKRTSEENMSRDGSADKSKHQVGSNSTKYSQKMNDKSVHYISGITKMKIPGHTGYLTFATVPPFLNRKNLPLTEKSRENISEEEKSKADTSNKNTSNLGTEKSEPVLIEGF